MSFVFAYICVPVCFYIHHFVAKHVEPILLFLVSVYETIVSMQKFTGCFSPFATHDVGCCCFSTVLQGSYLGENWL